MATDFLMTIDGIRGESKDAAIPNSIIVKTWSYGANSPTDFATKQATGQVQLSDLTFTKALDKSSPALLEMLGKNKVAKTVEFVCRKSGQGQKPFFVVTLKNARVRAVTTKVTPESDEPVETVSLSYQKITWSYKTQDDKGGMSGPVEYEHDVARNV